MALDLVGDDPGQAGRGVDGTRDPAGGQIVRDTKGKATGWLVDNAVEPVFAARDKAFAALPPDVQREEVYPELNSD